MKQLLKLPLVVISGASGAEASDNIGLLPIARGFFSLKIVNPATRYPLLY